MKTQIFNIHALSALHVGTGQGIGLIDLPIARERATNLPIIPGSGLKGVLRDELRPDDSKDRQVWLSLFGPETKNAEDDPFAGALMIGDAQLLCLPVRSLKGTFAWVTAPWVLRRYTRDLQLVGMEPPAVPTVDENNVLRTNQSTVVGTEEQVIIEDLQMTAAVNDLAQAWADLVAGQVFGHDESWQKHFKQRFLIVSDDEFNHLVEHATEVRARIRLQEETRSVARGALWYEENLPIESLLWGLLGCSSARQKGHDVDADTLMKELSRRLLPLGRCRLQLGGKATVGRGQVHFTIGEVS